MRPIVGRVLLLGFGLLMGLLLLEGALRLARPQIFRAPQGMYVADDAVGYALAPGFQGILAGSEFRTPFSTNQAGLRGAGLRPRQPHTVRILVLGDSQAWGYGVLDQETFPVQLEGLLAGVYPGLDIQVLNAGVPGYGTADQLAFLRSRGQELDPDLVVVQFLSVNDLKENRTPAATWATVEDGWLSSRKAEVVEEQARDRPSWLVFKNLLKQKSHLARFAIDSIGYMAIRAGLLGDADVLWGEDFTAEDARLGTELLVQIADEARALGAETLLLYTTGQASLYEDGSAYEPLRSAAVVEDAAREAGVPWIDGAQRLQAWDDRDGLYFRLNGHWTAAGQAAIADILAREIARLGIIEDVVEEVPEAAGVGSSLAEAVSAAASVGAPGTDADGGARWPAVPIAVPEQSEWQDRGVAIRRGEEGDWDRYLGGAFTNNIIKIGETYYDYYQGSETCDSTCDSVARRTIGVATSKDGIHWEKYANNPVITWSSRGSIEEGAAGAGVWPGKDGKVYLRYGANTGTGCNVNAAIRLAVRSDGYGFADAGVVAAGTDGHIWGRGDELFPRAAGLVGSYAFADCVYDSSVFYDQVLGRWLLL